MAQKGGRVDASGERIRSFRIVTDSDADSGIGSFLDPIRTDPVGTTVQPVSVVGTVTTTGGAGGGAATIADAADVAQGATTDAAVTSDVSGTLSAKLRGLVKIFGDVWDSVNHRFNVAVGNFPASQAVTGTFFQGTQPVSGTVTTTPPSNASANVAQFGASNVVTGTGAGGAGIPRVTVSSDSNVVVTPPTLTKATQGVTGFSTQDLKDAGRVLKTYTASAVVGVTTEALVTLTPYADLVAGGAATTFAVTAGKRLRLQAIVVTWRNNTAAAGGVTIRLRLLAGTVLVSSPVQASLNTTTALATIGSGATQELILPDGLELSGTMQFGLTQLAVGAVVGFDIHVIGYEY